jgi:hypothetical protein
LTLSVFRYREGFRWCIAGPGRPRYSPAGYGTEEGAATALLEELSG